MSKIAWIQNKLNELGANPKLAVDGMSGPVTRKAIRQFQEAKGLVVDGIAGPATLRALGYQNGNSNANLGVNLLPSTSDDMPVWLEEITRRYGLHERNNKRSLWRWLKSDGGTVGDPSKIPWCGDAAATPIALTLPDEPLPANPYWARNWAEWGVKCGPIVGAVGVIAWPKGGGHVGFVVKVEGNYVWLRGGNQKNKICDSRFHIKNFIAFRWPSTHPIYKYPQPQLLKGGGKMSRKATR